METLIVNLWGGPSVGKTAMALRLAGELSILMGTECTVEYVPEYAKGMIWRGEEALMIKQPLVTEGQIALLAPVGKVDVVITDSPIEVGLVYAQKEDLEHTQRLISEWESTYKPNSINIYIERASVSESNFQEKGRIHTLEESLKKDEEILAFLKKRGIVYTSVSQKVDILTLCKGVLVALKKDKICQ